MAGMEWLLRELRKLGSKVKAIFITCIPSAVFFTHTHTYSAKAKYCIILIVSFTSDHQTLKPIKGQTIYNFGFIVGERTRCFVKYIQFIIEE